MITPEGLQDQMLSIVVSQEDPELEQKRGELIVENAAYKNQLQSIEDRILMLLNASKGEILDDEELITTLGKSKVRRQSQYPTCSQSSTGGVPHH